MDFGVSTQDVDGIMIVTVTGEVDVHTAPSLDAEAVAAHRPGGRLIIDAGQVGFIDSTAVGVLIKAHQTALRTGGRLDVVVADDRVLRVLQITGLDAVLNIHPTREAALSAG
jgi:anti-anti-sigma factor